MADAAQPAPQQSPNLFVLFFGTVGRITLNTLHPFAQVAAMIVDTLNWLFIKPLTGHGLRVRAVISEYVQFGYRSIPIVGLICFLLGAILALQTAYQLERFGATRLIATLVGVAAMRELAPLMTAILLTGRSGSAITAEIGTMKVSEEIDALHVMGINPTKYLIVPKFLAMVLAFPCVTILATAIMILGGMSIGVFYVGIAPNVYLNVTAQALSWSDFLSGMTKSVFYGIVVCFVGVYRGFQVTGGAEGVGRMTTSSVVTSIFLIIVVDLIFTIMFVAPA